MAENKEKFSFMISSNPNHAFYQERLTVYRNYGLYQHDDDAQRLNSPKPYRLTTLLPQGITGKELDYIKLTALFVSRYGSYILGELMRRKVATGFEFLKPTHSRYEFLRIREYYCLAKVLVLVRRQFFESSSRGKAAGGGYA